MSVLGITANTINTTRFNKVTTSKTRSSLKFKRI